MKKNLTLLTLIFIFGMSACTPNLVTVVPTSVPTLPVLTEATQVPVESSPTVVTDPSATHKSYTNSAFGLSFQFPAAWFGPEEYISEQTLRVEVGSDKVYPYGTDPMERIYDLKNSYAILIQYTKNDQNTYWLDIYQSLINIGDGQSISDARGLLIRVRQLSLGNFQGIEYISTLSDTAQTSAFYSRQIILLDNQSNLLTIQGSPNNVEVPAGANWQDIYRGIDEANLTIFYELVDSVIIQ